MAERELFGLVQFNPFKTEWYVVPPEIKLKVGEMVVISDDDGEDLGRLVLLNAESTRPPEGMVLRRANAEDLQTRAELETKTVHALEVFRRLRDEYQLPLQVVGAHWRLDRKKICFYFTAEQRLNFQIFHKTLASALNVRVAIKQIGARDHVRLLGGIGLCGRVVCCKHLLKELKPITLRMARQQNLFVDPTKISGLCGKLLCCLSYEEEVYRRMINICPRVGERVNTPYGTGVVTAVDPLTHKLRVRYEDRSEQLISLEEITVEE